MLSERLMRERPAVVRAGLARRHADAETLATFDTWLALDAERRALATRYDTLASARPRRERNRPPASPTDAPPLRPAQAESASLQSAQADVVAAGPQVRFQPQAAQPLAPPLVAPSPADDTDDTPSARDEARHALTAIEARMRPLALRMPNLPDPRVPDGADARANVELRRWGDPPTFDFMPLSHEELGARLGIWDAARATRLAGPRFPLLVGLGARLARTLAALMLDMHAARGYVEVAPPHLLRTATLEGTGHLPRHQDDLFAIPRDDLYLSPTAEAQLVALHAGETLPERALPLAYTAHTPAFRRESSTGNAQTHGLIRQRQFDKVELVRVVTPEEADAAFEALLADAEAVLRRLALPYRVVMLCAGDLPFSAQRTVDLEVWMAGQPALDGVAGGASVAEIDGNAGNAGIAGRRGRYVEVASISDCGPFQARRLNMRYQPTRGGATRYPHTLNASALAIGRTLAALLENNQRADGSVALPPPSLGPAGLRMPSPTGRGMVRFGIGGDWRTSQRL